MTRKRRVKANKISTFRKTTNTFMTWLKGSKKLFFALALFIGFSENKVIEGIQWEMTVSKSFKLGDVPRTQEEMMLVAVLSEFITEAAKNQVKAKLEDVTFEFQDSLESHKADLKLPVYFCGVCYMGRKHIQLSKAFITPGAYQEFKATVYHELGHCIYDLGHYESYQGLPPLMYKEKANWDELVHVNPQFWDIQVENFFTDVRNKPKPKTYVERRVSALTKRGQQALNLWKSFVAWIGFSKT